jgi:hypothetical protein
LIAGLRIADWGAVVWVGWFGKKEKFAFEPNQFNIFGGLESQATLEVLNHFNHL